MLDESKQVLGQHAAWPTASGLGLLSAVKKQSIDATSQVVRGRGVGSIVYDKPLTETVNLKVDSKATTGPRPAFYFASTAEQGREGLARPPGGSRMLERPRDSSKFRVAKFCNVVVTMYTQTQWHGQQAASFARLYYCC